MIRPYLPRWRVALRLWPRAAEAYEMVEWVNAATRAGAREAVLAPLYKDRTFCAFLVREIREVTADEEARERRRYRVRGTSSRTGAVMWVRQDGTPTEHKGEGGRWSLDDAQREIEHYTAALVRAVGRCAWLLEPVEIADEDAARKVG